MNKSNNKNFLNGLIFPILLAFPIIFSSHSLQKGQVIKQFFTYSITESLFLRPFNWLSTTLPCIPTRIWVEEPPIFHFLASLLLNFSNQALLLPLVAYMILLFSVLLFIVELNLKSKTTTLNGIFISIAMCPIFLRYSIQHIPDLLATSLTCIGAYALWKNKRNAGILLFTLGVTTKVLTLFAIIPILAWDIFFRSEYKFKNAILKFLFLIGFTTLPFYGWLFFIWYKDIPSPFFLKNIIENRHSGEMFLLINLKFWIRFFSWVAIKGVGVVLFLFSVIRIYKLIKNKKWSGIENIFLFWTFGIVPYWILVRQGNFVHDYYTLPFAFPFAFLGAIEIATSKKFHHSKILFFLINIIIGFFSLTSMRAVPIENQNRPMLCNMDPNEQIAP